jgi:hypothetical protein
LFVGVISFYNDSGFDVSCTAKASTRNHLTTQFYGCCIKR